MKIPVKQWPEGVFVFGLFTFALFGCVYPEGRYEPRGDMGPGYYEPYGSVYGGWGPDYRVAPYRGNGHHYSSAHGPMGMHAYRGSSSRAFPSLPSHARTGGGGGGRGSRGGR